MATATPKKADTKKRVRTIARVPGKTTTTSKIPYRIDYKKGTRVKVERRNGVVMNGFVERMDLTGATGAFVVVNFKDEGEVLCRPGRVKAF